jgi:hypothetical protein
VQGKVWLHLHPGLRRCGLHRMSPVGWSDGWDFARMPQGTRHRGIGCAQSERRGSIRIADGPISEASLLANPCSSCTVDIACLERKVDVTLPVRSSCNFPALHPTMNFPGATWISASRGVPRMFEVPLVRYPYSARCPAYTSYEVRLDASTQ